MDQKGLQKLLKLSTSLHTDEAAASSDAATSRPKLDAAMLNHIMGPDDATLMMQAMQAIEDNSMSRDNHEIAFENLEGLVEQIDNAKNLQSLGLWPPILKQLDKSDAFYRKNGCAVIAAACQNNPATQEAFVKANGLERVVDLFSNETDVSVRRKALFAITSTLRNSDVALQRFASIGGWQVFSAQLEGIQDLALQKRLVFFLQSLYFTGESLGVDTEIKMGFMPKLQALTASREAQEDEDFKEKLQDTIETAQKWRAESS
ncbi:armadillo-type protein [Protomyces lactucae-debilis]|uniref:Armadillo-type protein n=1 Tax=Protomyces lactucae-debilis TaxID=2754530 RepID=A0A1Y2F2U3_PROLT|nr:armadillo-type protein [Protomyces lactucae-debilis]ORY77285.1 armadillo-type protein [Protomyces lactucae-debilis]